MMPSQCVIVYKCRRCGTELTRNPSQKEDGVNKELAEQPQTVTHQCEPPRCGNGTNPHTETVGLCDVVGFTRFVVPFPEK